MLLSLENFRLSPPAPTLLEGSDEDLVRELLRRAILTLASLADPDLRYRLGPRTAWPPYVQHARDAYASAPPNIRVFHPTSRDIEVVTDVLRHLAKYGREQNTQDLKLFHAWVFGASTWMLQMRVTTNRRQPASPSTVRNRLNRLVKNLAAIPAVVALARGSVDILRTLPQSAPLSGYGADSAQTDLRDLPTSPKAWSEPGEKPVQSSREKRAARSLLTRRLKRNKSRSLRRKEQAKRNEGKP